MKQFIIHLLSATYFITGCINANTSGYKPNQQLLDSLEGQSPYLTKDHKGNIVLSWVRMVNDSVSTFCYAVSKNGGKSFETPQEIPNSNNIQPHSENLPKIIFKPSGEVIALWGAANPNPQNKYSGLVFYSQSFDEGKTWSDAKPLINDTLSYDQRYYDVALLPNGEAAIVWLDNRKATEKEGSALYFATTNGREGFTNEKRIGEFCCPCCRTDLFIDKNDGIHVLYRGIIQDSIRDMVHTASTDGGTSFSVPKRISDDNWIIKGCPHTGPSMTETNKGLHFSWFTGGKNKGCFYTQSTDNGNSFTKQDSISSLGSHPQMTGLSDGSVLIAWDETINSGDEVIKKVGIQKRNPDGTAKTKQFITQNNDMASYPVVIETNKSSCLVAYSIKRNQKSLIAWQVIQ